MTSRDEINIFKKSVEAAENIFIAAHVGPDGDTLGSMLGLKHALKLSFPNIKRVDAVISGRIPDVYTFMPGINEIINAEKPNSLLEQYDLAFSMDCGSAERLGLAKSYFLNAKQSINIDHHFSNSKFGKINIIDIDAAASGQVIADLLIGNNIDIDADIATCLYIAILTDTGGFKYANTNARLFDLAAMLTRSGANPENIYRHIYEEIPKVQSMIQAEAIKNAQFNDNETLCWSVVTLGFMEEFNASEEHIEGLVEALRRIDTVIVSAVLRETRDGGTKVSLRSDTPVINVSDVAARWNGGGHKMAAGYTVAKHPKEAEKELIPQLKELVKAGKVLPVEKQGINV